MLAANAAPSLPSGPLKPKTMDSEPSESGVSTKTSKRRMSNDKSGPLNGMPDVATFSAQVANACLPAGQCPNKTPIFISGVRENRAFLAWLRASCPSCLMEQLKSEKLMVVPSTADGFRAVVSALRSLDGKEGVSFHTFTLLEDRCARLLVKKFGRGLPESVVREELESLNICVRGVTQLRSGRRNPDPSKDRPPHPLHCVSGARTRGVQGALNHRTLRPASVGGFGPGPQGSAAMQALPTLWPHAAQLWLRTSMRRLWWLPTLRWLLYPVGPACVL